MASSNMGYFDKNPFVMLWVYGSETWRSRGA